MGQTEGVDRANRGVPSAVRVTEPDLPAFCRRLLQHVEVAGSVGGPVPPPPVRVEHYGRSGGFGAGAEGLREGPHQLAQRRLQFGRRRRRRPGHQEQRPRLLGGQAREVSPAASQQPPAPASPPLRVNGEAGHAKGLEVTPSRPF